MYACDAGRPGTRTKKAKSQRLGMGWPRTATAPIRSITLHREDKRSRWRGDMLTPSRDIGDHIITPSITLRSRTVRRWLIVMMTSRHRVQLGHHRHNCLRPSDLHMVSHSQIRRRLPNARQREATERWKLQGRQDFSSDVNATHPEINHAWLIRCGASCRMNTRQTNFCQSWNKFCPRREHRPWKTFKGSFLSG